MGNGRRLVYRRGSVTPPNVVNQKQIILTEVSVNENIQGSAIKVNSTLKFKFAVQCFLGPLAALQWPPCQPRRFANDVGKPGEH